MSIRPTQKVDRQSVSRQYLANVVYRAAGVLLTGTIEVGQEPRTAQLGRGRVQWIVFCRVLGRRVAIRIKRFLSMVGNFLI